jgi:hypothetical protein
MFTDTIIRLIFFASFYKRSDRIIKLITVREILDERHERRILTSRRTKDRGNASKPGSAVYAADKK